MKIIISPAKQMKLIDDYDLELTQPIFLSKSNELVKYIKTLRYEEIKKYFKCSDKLVLETMEQYISFEKSFLSPAILCFTGIQYQYMSPGVFNDDENKYIQKHVRILSGLYGILKPFDGIRPYRLEMGLKYPFSLYEYWSDLIANSIEDDIILNLASEEYAKCIRKYKKVVDVRFCQNNNGKLVEKAVYAKMARGAMVRFLAENKIESIDKIKLFHEFNYEYSKENSTDTLYTFIQKEA